MLLLEFFPLFAKQSSPKFGQESDRGGTKRGEGLQKGAELPGNGEEKEKLKERRKEEVVHKTEKYRFINSGIGNSWLIGDDTTNDANAYVNYRIGCEETLVIPHNLTDENQNTKNVEVIGQFAFCTCGAQWNNGITRSIVLSRYIKVIKQNGFGRMDEATSFRIEEGSILERIEKYGLSYMSYLNYSDDVRGSILVLPSTVISVAGNGLYQNNPIKTIYYCGSTHLKNNSKLTYGVSAPDIKVTSSYTYDKIFKDCIPKNDSSSIAEAEEICKNYGFIPKASPSRSVSPSKSKPPTAKATKSPSHSPAASSQPTADYQVRGRPISLLRRLSRAGRSGRMGVGSLRRGELQTAESDPE